ncbi:uncharacterized protein DSM5745_09518 [Aspergillus mulundensis]|uniref:Alcohol acetyltransferase n=1 Tax=Aspergillus mulundensis TaxID=1810919 RepID=A0A3D8QVI7_9EURO|nr:hypothetical protein DSM5745_09518 [Aspergillus mulundensis]RDW65779.1 hypothetical protein DSM5745_09518 [Aspergillus mulundensis]
MSPASLGLPPSLFDLELDAAVQYVGHAVRDEKKALPSTIFEYDFSRYATGLIFVVVLSSDRFSPVLPCLANFARASTIRGNISPTVAIICPVDHKLESYDSGPNLRSYSWPARLPPATKENFPTPMAHTTLAPQGGVLRAASKNEHRYITRHALGFYRALTMTGLYTLDLDTGLSTSESSEYVDMTIPDTYIPALKWCIAAHPILRTGIQGQDGEEPVFVRAPKMDLRRHVRVDCSIMDGGVNLDGKSEVEALRRVLLREHDEGFEGVENVPPWRVVVAPLPVSDIDGYQRNDARRKAKAYIIFAYSHSHGDGRSGLVFHRAFLEGLRGAHRVYDKGYEYATTIDHQGSVSEVEYQLPPPLEEACALRITWSYLLLTLFGAHLPAFVSRWFGFQTPAVTEGTWTGEVMMHDSESFRTGAAILIVEERRLDTVLKTCREKGGARFTGLLNQLVVRALSGALSAHTFASEASVNNFIGQIVIDLRRLVPAYSDDMMVNCVSAASECSPRVPDDQDEDLRNNAAFWDAVRQTTLRLARSSSTLVDQPIGLLRYLDKFRPWFLEKLGKRRDSSYEISNAVVFDPSPGHKSTSVESNNRKEEVKMDWNIERMVMSQPANVTGCPLSFSVVTRKGGDMALTLNWQVGVLGIEDEDGFAEDVLKRIDGLLAGIAGV